MSAAAEVFGEALPKASRYVDILSSRGIEWGLIGPREGPRLWDRHILNSAALTDLIPQGTTVADIGSGAGLPGIPLAILRPDLQVTLVEPLLRRATFLTQAVDELGITDRVRVVRSRAEDHHETYDVVVARALAPLDRLVVWCAPLRSPGGSIIALKGRSAAEELTASRKVLAAHGLAGEVLTVRAHPSAESTAVIRLTGLR
ncbi:MAG: 16S rRNA (guanine(527)-N(7))-methyltransferase RsmG [Friedmanniella sp.]